MGMLIGVCTEDAMRWLIGVYVEYYGQVDGRHTQCY
jgi:hypothetical protein